MKSSQYYARHVAFIFTGRAEDIFPNGFPSSKWFRFFSCQRRGAIDRLDEVTGLGDRIIVSNADFQYLQLMNLCLIPSPPQHHLYHPHAIYDKL
jgi:hypothetical protein